MQPTTVLTWIGAGSGITATVMAFLTWLATRQRAPFSLSLKREGVALLTRMKRPAVQTFEVFVHCRGPLFTRDNAGTVEFRYLKRDDVLVLDVQDIPVGEALILRYRHAWPWDPLVPRSRTSAAGTAAPIGDSRGVRPR